MCLPIFDPKKVTTLYHSLYTPDLSLPDYFLLPKLKMKLKGLHFADVAEIQEAITDKLQKVQKEEFSAAFQKLYDCAKTCIFASGAYFKYKNVCLPHVYLIFKKISPKTFGSTVLCISSSASKYTGPLAYKLFKGKGISSCMGRQSCTAS